MNQIQVYRIPPRTGWKRRHKLECCKR